MNKEQKISMRIKELNKERELLKDLVLEKDMLIKEQEDLYRGLYREFFLSKKSKDFVLYDRFPSFQVVRSYYSKLPVFSHPLMEYGEFDIKELAEVIKLLYSFQRQKEYKIVTSGQMEWNGISRLDPNIYFLIGDDKTLENYLSYYQCFFEKEDSFFSFDSLVDFTYLKADKIVNNFNHYPIDEMLKMSCHILDVFVSGSLNLETEIAYYDYLKKNYFIASFSKNTNIFKSDVCSDFVHYKGIKDTLSMPFHINDSFVAKALISIAIYKKNHQKTSLDNEDYRYIFYEMFHEDVNIEKEVEQDIPKKLKYVPR